VTPHSISSSPLAAPVLALSLALSLFFTSNVSSAFASTKLAQTPVEAAPTGDFTTDGDKHSNQDKKEVEDFLASLESSWNRHELEAVMGNYADDYINNDGIDKGTVKGLTSEFWKTYPDAKINSTIKSVRVEGAYAVVDTSDIAFGTTATEYPSINSKGELQSVSEGRLYLKKIGGSWKIIGDRIDFEKVKVSFGLAKQLKASFVAPEQIRSGKQFAAKIDVSLPPGLHAIGSIANQPLKYPQGKPQETPRPFEGTGTLERVMNANAENCNELLTARVLLTNPARDKVLGLSVFTRRLNVIPEHKPESVIGEGEKTVVKAQE